MKLFQWILRLWHDFWSFRSTMKEWLGEGGRPVGSDLAASRALLCRGCAFNQRGVGYADSAAEAFKRHLEAKMKARLSVLKEDELHTCELCRCYLPLKIHVPHLHIRRHQREDVRKAIMNGKPSCWQLSNDR